MGADDFKLERSQRLLSRKFTDQHGQIGLGQERPHIILFSELVAKTNFKLGRFQRKDPDCLILGIWHLSSWVQGPQLPAWPL